MIAKIIGWFWVIMGVFFILKPNLMRLRFQRKSSKVIRKYFFAVALVAGVLLISAAWGFKGFLPKLLVILGIISIIRGVFFIKAKSTEKLSDWFSLQPLLTFQSIAAVQVVIGLLLVFGLKK